jgi:hypothetical protein
LARRQHLRPARLHGGWVGVWRSLMDHPLWNAPAAWIKIYIALLMQANYEPGTWQVGTQQVTVPAGSLVIGTISFAEICGVSRQQLRSALDYLVKTRLITIKTTRQFSLVTLNDTVAYRDEAGRNNQLHNPTHKPVRNQNGNPLVTTKEEEENLRKEEKLSSVSLDALARDAEHGLAPFLPAARTRTNPVIDISPEFQEFWELYPRREGVAEASKEFRRMVTAGVPATAIIEGLRACLPALLSRDPKFRPQPARWLREGRWTDDPEAVAARELTPAERLEQQMRERFEKEGRL